MTDPSVELKTLLSMDKVSLALYVLELLNRVNHKQHALDYYEDRSERLGELCKEMYICSMREYGRWNFAERLRFTNKIISFGLDPEGTVIGDVNE